METLEYEHSTITDDRSTQKAKISFPEEIIEAILSRLPIKSILRFKSVSKPWRSLTSTSSFTRLHSTVGPRTTALFFTACDSSTNTRYFFSGAQDERSVANLMKLDNTPYSLGRAEHLNGLVCFTPRSCFIGTIYTYVLNPSTHRFFKLPDPPVPLLNYTKEEKDMCYFFGFDESSKEHKVLYIDVELIKPTTIEVMIFSMSCYSWRKTNVDLPVGMSRSRWWYRTRHSVCVVNSTIHMMLRDPLEILAFDLRTDKFSIIDVPQEGAIETVFTSVYPYAQFVNINDLLGIACIYPMELEEADKVDIWILQDYQNRVWVRETITFPPKSQIQYNGRGPFPFDSVNTDEIFFTPRMLSEDLISVPIYNIKSRCFKTVEVTLGHRFLCPKSVNVELIKCYVESLIPIQN